MRRFLLLFATVFLSVAAFAAEEFKYECLFGTSHNKTGVSSYEKSWKTTNEGKTWAIANFNNSNNAWSYVRCGRKSAASVATVTTDFAFTEAITKVTISIDAVTVNAVKSITLYSSTTSNFTSKETLGTFTVATGDQSVTIGTPTAGRYYMVEFNMLAKSNGSLQLSKVSYYYEGTGGGEVGPTVSAPTIAAEYNQVSLACETKDATIYYTRDGSTPDENSTKYTEPFSITAPTTVKAIAITSEGSSSVTTQACDYYITSMSEFNSIADATGYKVHLTDAIVAAADNSATKRRIFLTDGTYGVMIYSDYTKDVENPYTPGDVIATVDGDLNITTKSAQIRNAVLGGKVAGPAPTPTVATLDMFVTDNINKYVVVNNVEFTQELSKYYISDGTNKVECYNSLNIVEIPGDGTYNVEGFILNYNGTWEIIPTKFVSKSLSFSTNSVTMTYGDAIPEFKLENPAEVALTWSSSDDKVATVDADGKVTVVGVGTTTIKAAETGNVSNFAELTFTVNPIAGNISYFADKFVVLKDADFVAPVLTNPHGLNVTYASNNEDVLVDENTGDVVIDTKVADVTATITATATAQGNYAASTASYTIVVKEEGAGSGTPESTTEVLDIADFGSPASYSAKEYTNNGINYWGVMMKRSNSEAIQIRSDAHTIDANSVHSGIVVKANENGYVLRKVTITWDGSNSGDQIDVYGRSSAFVSTNDMWDVNTEFKNVTKIASLAYNNATEGVLAADIEGDYQYIGIRSKDGAAYITSITLEWEGAAAGAPTFSATLSLSTATEGGESANVLSLSDITGTVDLAGKNVYLNDRNICGADASATYLPYLADGVFTVVDGTTAYALNATLPDLSTIAAKVTKVAYKAWKDNDHLISEGMWYLDAEYTVAVDTEMDLVADFYFEGYAGREGHVKSVTGNTAYVEGIGYFTVTPTTGSDGKTHDVYEYITDAAGDFMVTPQFPFFAKSGMSDMIKAPEGTSRIVAINGTVAMVEVDKLAEQPSAEGGNVSGVESVVVDSEGAVEYYNLQGVRVDGALTPGIYIRRCGNTATKISIR